jgi:hypothetical protein
MIDLKEIVSQQMSVATRIFSYKGSYLVMYSGSRGV